MIQCFWGFEGVFIKTFRTCSCKSTRYGAMIESFRPVCLNVLFLDGSGFIAFSLAFRVGMVPVRRGSETSAFTC